MNSELIVELIQNIGLFTMIILQIGCAYIAFKAYVDIRSNGSSSFWWFLWVGFTLMAFRRVTALLTRWDITLYNHNNISLSLIDKLILPLIITVFLFFGMKKVYNYNITRENKFNNQHKELKKLRELSKKLNGGVK